MTRRAPRRTGKMLSLNEYIHRATLGLPKTERLDAAAELRVHLLEQVAVLEAKGFAREEAEFLAVQAMGTVRLSPRSLLGRTRILGWTVPSLMSLATGSWWVYNNLMPPREGIEIGRSRVDSNGSVQSPLSSEDMTHLWSIPDSPRGIDESYSSAVLTYPKVTKAIYYAYVSPNHVIIQSNALLTTNEYDVSKRFPGSYRYQERWLIAQEGGSPMCPQDWNLFSSVRIAKSSLSYIDSSVSSPPNLNLGKVAVYPSDTFTPVCTGMKVLPTIKLSANFYMGYSPISGGVLAPISESASTYQPLLMNRWTVLQQLLITSKVRGFPNLPPNFKDTSVYLAVLPSDRAASPSNFGEAFKRDGNGKITKLTYGGQPLPDLPASDWAEFKRNLPGTP